jgi:hypothetical protein
MIRDMNVISCLIVDDILGVLDMLFIVELPKQPSLHLHDAHHSRWSLIMVSVSLSTSGVDCMRAFLPSLKIK